MNSFTKFVTSSANRLLAATKNRSRSVYVHRTLLLNGHGEQTQRGFTRSLWYMCNDSQQKTAVHTPTLRHNSWTKMCDCCGMHTQVEKDLIEFLEDEIKYEKDAEKTPGKLPVVKGFEVSTDGAEVTLKKKTDNEIVEVTFSVNNTMDPAMAEMSEGEQDQEQEEPPMVSKPPFTVKINKGGELTLAVILELPIHDSPNVETVEGEEVPFNDMEILEVAILKGTEWSEKVYTLSGQVLDGNLYHSLFLLLEERGIDAAFIDQLVEFSTGFEHKKYINFLEQLKEFASSK